MEKNKKFKIKGSSKYFKEKYGTSNPEIIIEDTWIKVFGKSWMCSDGNPAAMNYWMRAAFDGLPTDNEVYYGKIKGMGELVHISELEEVK